ncbi:MAG: S1C family serine protease [Acidimicrobiales bacterium]
MPADDADDDATPVGRPLPPDDRLWRHPAEVAWSSAPGASDRPSRRLWGVALASGVTGALVALGVVALVTGFERRVTERITERVALQDALADPLSIAEPSALPALVDLVAPSVVRLEVSAPTGTRVGSAVVLRDDGYLVTNAHVVDGADAITITTSSGDTVGASVVDSDPATDIAVIAVDDADRAGTEWVPAVFGTSDGLRVGEPAVAVGSPLGLAGGPSVTVGVISGLGRRVQATNGLSFDGLIQTDAPISQGSSGGALIDASGAVVGITTAVAVGDSAGEGIGFAIPVDVARATAERLLGDDDGNGNDNGGDDYGAVAPGSVWLGIEGADSDAVQQVAVGAGGGVTVLRVVPGGPAEQAGLAGGDVILGLDGERLTSMSALVDALDGYAPGDTVSITVLRGGESLTLDVVLGAR